MSISIGTAWHNLLVAIVRLWGRVNLSAKVGGGGKKEGNLKLHLLLLDSAASELSL